MGLVGGERVEGAGHADGTTGTDGLGHRLPVPPGGSPLAIGGKEQRGSEVPACGVSLPDPGPKLEIPGLLPVLWQAVPGVWWSTSPAGPDPGHPGHATFQLR
jgi:hypothetical protein